MKNPRRWLVVAAVLVAVFFGENVAEAIFGPLITNLGAFLPAV